MIKSYIIIKILDQLVKIISVMPTEKTKDVHSVACKKIIEILEGFSVSKV